jgi:hypothetical protein
MPRTQAANRRPMQRRKRCQNSVIRLATLAHRPPRPQPRSAGDNSNVQVIVEIEAAAATVERLFMISERQEWTFGETLEYALDALELALAKLARA